MLLNHYFWKKEWKVWRSLKNIIFRKMGCSSGLIHITFYSHWEKMFFKWHHWYGKSLKKFFVEFISWTWTQIIFLLYFFGKVSTTLPYTVWINQDTSENRYIRRYIVHSYLILNLTNIKQKNMYIAKQENLEREFQPYTSYTSFNASFNARSISGRLYFLHSKPLSDSINSLVWKPIYTQCLVGNYCVYNKVADSLFFSTSKYFQFLSPSSRDKKKPNLFSKLWQ